MIRIALLALAFVSSVAMAAGSTTFKMYPKPFAKPNPSCDVYTSMKIDFNGNTVTATLENKLTGMCEIFVEPNGRAYFAQLSKVNDGCGSNIYVARERGTGRIMFQVTDHRARICENMLPALIEVSEFDDRGVETKLYSQDN